MDDGIDIFGLIGLVIAIIALLMALAVPVASYPDALLVNGSRPLTDNWDQGAYNLTNSNSWFLGNTLWDNIDGKPIISSLSTVSYIVYTYNSTYYARNGFTGAIDYTDSGFIALLRKAQSNLIAGEIRILNGTYWANSETLNLKRRISYIGENTLGVRIYGNSTVFRSPGNTSYAFFGIRIAYLTLIGDLGTGDNGIDFSYTYSNVRLDHLSIEKFDDGMKLTNCYLISVTDSEIQYSKYAGIDTYRCNGITLDNIKLYGNLHGVTLQASTGAHIMNSGFEENTGTGVIVTTDGTYRTEKASITNSYFEGNGRDIGDKGIATTIRDNYLINVHSVVYSIVVEKNSSTIDTNEFRNYTKALWIVTGARNTLVTNNVILATSGLMDDDGTGTRHTNNRSVSSWLD